MAIEAFIFDLDGVITDTAEYHYLAWKKLADEEGFPFDREVNEKLRGVSRRASLEIILDGKDYPEERIREMMDRKNRYYVDYIHGITPKDILPGMEAFLGELRSRGIAMAVGSASKNARPVIKNLGLCDYFPVIADGFSVERTKPAPDLFLYAAERLEKDPARCVVVEDAESGVEAALAGGLFAVGIGPQKRVGRAHLRYDRPCDMNLEAILKLSRP